MSFEMIDMNGWNMPPPVTTTTTVKPVVTTTAYKPVTTTQQLKPVTVTTVNRDSRTVNGWNMPPAPVTTTTVKPVVTTTAYKPVTTTQELKPVTVTTPNQEQQNWKKWGVSGPITTANILALNAANYAKKGENATTIFMIMVMVVGLITFWVTWNVDKDIQNDAESNPPQVCSSKLKTTNKIALCLSTVLIVFPITYFISIRHGNCDGGSTFNYKNYIYIVFVLGIVLTVLGGIISYESKKCTIKSNPWIIWVIGVLIMISSVGALWYSNKK